MKRVKKFFWNAVLMTATALLMRTVGVSFGVYLSNQIGESGMGLYQLIMSVYTLAVTIATSGVSLAATRLVAEELGRGSQAGARRAMVRCLLYSLLCGSAAATALLWKADFIGAVLLDDARTILSLRFFAISLPFIGMSSALGGYFTAVRRVYKSASAQVFEQLVRIVLTVMGLTLLMPRGLEYACLAIVGGGSLAELCSFFYSYLFYRIDRRRYRAAGQVPPGLTQRLLGISVPVALSAYARSGLTTIEHLLIPRGLRRYGLSRDQALASYGLLHGMVLPVVLFPAAFLQALAGLLIPEMAECRAQNHEIRINYIAGRVFQVTLLFSIGISGLMFSFSRELSMAIYHNLDSAPYIRLLAPLIPVMYLDTAVDGMLKGLGEQVSSMRYNLVDAACSVVLVFTLVPRIGIAGYVITIFFTELLNALLSTHRLVSITRFEVDLFACVVGPIAGALGSSAAAQLLFRLAGWSFSSAGMAATMQIALAACIYLLFLCLSSCITREDLDWAVGIFRS